MVDGASRLLARRVRRPGPALAVGRRRRRAAARRRGRDRGRGRARVSGARRRPEPRPCGGAVRPAGESGDVSQRIVVIGGGSYQWVPKLLVDVANTPSLVDAEIVLARHRPGAVAADGRVGRAHRRARSIPLSVRTTTDRRDALADADHVVVDDLDRRVRVDAPRPRDPTRGTASRRASATRSVPAASPARCATSRSSSPSRATWRSAARRVDAQHHEPDDHDLPGDDAGDVDQDRRALPRGHDPPVLPDAAARRRLPRRSTSRSPA